MALKDKTPPDESGSKGQAKTTPRRTAPRKGSDLDKVRTSLTEMLETIAGGQQLLGTFGGDRRMLISGQVTEKFSDPIVNAWINLAEKSPAVKSTLLKMTQGTAYGEVVFVTIGFAYTQAQVFGAVPSEAPNPFMDWSEIVTPSDEVVAATANGATRTVPDMPIEPDAEQEAPTDTRADSTAPAMSQAEQAEAERKAAEERRKHRVAPTVEPG